MLQFFEKDRTFGSGFRVVYNLYMQLKILSKVIVFYNIDDLCHKISRETVAVLEEKLDVLFDAQILVLTTGDILTTHPNNTTRNNNTEDITVAHEAALTYLEGTTQAD